MNIFDYVVLAAVILGIAVYGILRTRRRRTLHDYLRGKKQSWFVIGLSVMATQASAITFLSTPGQGYADGMKFIQNYFAIPLALVIIAAFFLPIYRKLNVYTAYEYIGNRFDKKTRLLAASIFLLNRGIGAGFTIYAPAIVLSTVFGWSLTATIVSSSLVVTLYTVLGGSDAVSHTQKYQLAIIFGGMVTAFVILLSKIPCSFTDALTLAGHFGKTNAVSFAPNLKDRYTIWSGMLGGTFLMLSYFGTDQSQVQRYISGDDLRESRLGLMFNALFKIPMQFGILLLGVMLFVFYLFNPSPFFFNRSELQKHVESTRTMLVETSGGGSAPSTQMMTESEAIKFDQRMFVEQDSAGRQLIQEWLRLRASGDSRGASDVLDKASWQLAYAQSHRDAAKSLVKVAQPHFNTNDNDYVFITFILDNLPHGLIGLLVACFFAAALSSKAAELNALASCTTIDIYRHIIRPPRSLGVSPMSSGEGRGEGGTTAPSADETLLPQANVAAEGARTVDDNSALAHRRDADATADRHYVRASKLFTLLWGLIALAFALFCNLSENLIQATNIVASLFYPILLSLFICGFFLKFLSATPVFIGALAAQALVLTLYFTVPDSTLSYLWYNPIGVLACITVATALQPVIGKPPDLRGFPVEEPKVAG